MFLLQVPDLKDNINTCFSSLALQFGWFCSRDGTRTASVVQLVTVGSRTGLRIISGHNGTPPMTGVISRSLVLPDARVNSFRQETYGFMAYVPTQPPSFLRRVHRRSTDTAAAAH